MERIKYPAGKLQQIIQKPVIIPADEVELQGDLSVPEKARGIVLFAHGSGSSRMSPRNRYVAGRLNEEGLATLLFDLLTPAEEDVDLVSGELRFDIGLLSRRLLSVSRWVKDQSDISLFPLGYFGASTGAAAALVAAGIQPEIVGAVVSRGGRPDLAGEALADVLAPTLLIVGGGDDIVIELNRAAAKKITAPHAIEIVPGATHLFEEPGKLDEVARLSVRWFKAYLKVAGTVEEEAGVK